MSTFFAIIFGIIFTVIHTIYTITPGKHTPKVAKTVTGHDRPLVDTVKAWWIVYRKHFFFDFRTVPALYCNTFIPSSQHSISTENYTLLHTLAHLYRVSTLYVCTRVMHTYTRTRVMYNFHDPIFMCNFSLDGF